MRSEMHHRKDDDGFILVGEKNRVPLILLFLFLLGTGTVIYGAIFSPGYRAAPALIWAFGFTVSGLLIGFLFAIPRTLPAGTVHAPEPAGDSGKDEIDPTKGDVRRGTQNAGAVHTPSEINSNLVEVSDWLTKIIVGVGLVEAKDLPQNAESVAAFISPSLGVTTSIGTPLAGGIILFFSVLGFLAGYLLTRIYLAVIIKWADNQVKIQNQPVRLESGTEIEVGELTRLQQNSLNDLQDTVAELVFATPQNAATISEKETKPSTGLGRRSARILWVDDHPENNTLLVEQLTRANVLVEQVSDTDEAISRLATQQFDVVITDMRRTENGVSTPDAGIRLIHHLKRVKPDLQVLIFCSVQAALRYADSGAAAGARITTSSETKLMAVLKKIIRSLDDDRT